MRFEEEVRILCNLHMAQPASWLGYVNGISRLGHYPMRHVGSECMALLCPAPQR